MLSSYTYKPVKFFLLAFIVSWTIWSGAIYVSWQPSMHYLLLPLILVLCMMVGLFSPFVTTIIMIYSSKNKALIADFWDKFTLAKIKIRFIPILLLVMPIVVLSSTAISVLFGESTDQFFLASNFRIWTGHGVLGFAIMLLASVIEELAWRGYGIDALRSHYTVFKATIILAMLLALWHVPLFFINGYYHNQLWHLHSIYVLNFFVSIIPATILINWVYYANNRSIVAAIMLHLMLNLSSVMLQTTQFTKCIVTVLLLILSCSIITGNKRLWES